jgi:hypothetical protein
VPCCHYEANWREEKKPIDELLYGPGICDQVVVVDNCDALVRPGIHVLCQELREWPGGFFRCFRNVEPLL